MRFWETCFERCFAPLGQCTTIYFFLKMFGSSGANEFLKSVPEGPKHF